MKPSVIEYIVENDLCIGCGMCVAFCPSKALAMDWDEDGLLKPVPINKCDLQNKCLSVCPFNLNPIDELRTENEISLFYNKEKLYANKIIGKYIDLFAGFSNEFRFSGSSGGIATWLLSKLLREKYVDHIVALKDELNPDKHFEYTIVNNHLEVEKLSKTKYYPVSLERIIERIKDIDGRIAIIALPCFVKAIRLAQYYEPTLNYKIKYIVGIFCGGLKSKFYTEYLASKIKVNSTEIKNPAYRIKDSNSSSSDFSFGCIRKESNEFHSFKMKEVGDMWGPGFFKPNACDYCDDLSAELADISLGDAWIPPYIYDGKGNNIIITRNKFISELLHQAIHDNELNLTPISLKETITSQQGNYNHRRIGLRYRLFKRKSKSIPPKRVKGGIPLNILVCLVQTQRTKIRKFSFEFWKRTRDFNNFENLMRPHLKKLQWYTKINHLFRLSSYLKRIKKYLKIITNVFAQ